MRDEFAIEEMHIRAELEKMDAVFCVNWASPTEMVSALELVSGVPLGDAGAITGDVALSFEATRVRS